MGYCFLPTQFSIIFGYCFLPKFFFSTIFKISISTIFNIVWVLFSIYSNFSTTFKISGYGFLPTHIFQQVSNFSTIIYLFIYFIGYCFLPTIFIAAGYCFLPTQFSIILGTVFYPNFSFQLFFKNFNIFGVLFSTHSIFNNFWVLFSTQIFLFNYFQNFHFNNFQYCLGTVFYLLKFFNNFQNLWVRFPTYSYLSTSFKFFHNNLFIYLFIGYCFLPTIFIAAGYCFLPTQFSIIFGYCFLPTILFSIIFYLFQYLWGFIYPLNFQ